ncbi:putative zinc finger in N-recognin-domain-containing protein [Phycomyces blakesleeanus]|uniref:UBR-type domain-containing protein n=2 Tax=Phycomyces blakesleeanus TaxID=4837 RepID=A0A167JM94_PHYB8|nr:hypothetical protein PHYBLDRAFT_152624 [Phycomyces blakesleeanus NRRL 1555(-)]OAD66297.1 hypothetical protein PHYBLDRAFT_152624 [Phycomyces blakesleeanus NRRL 1555(-)]|eukprot:XP_018284337.1 hypothetical protein PHYBLDRAFT_152624 [Phycomyces blakesleeanus NRRL 1555(-)]
MSLPCSPTLKSSDDTITAVDFISQQTILEQDAREALPGNFETCTFDMGYIRQNVYACKTCNGSEPAGMCYSCSMTCHNGHDILELFPKRHFRCDCGTPSKLNGHPCSLSKGTPKEKKTVNEENKYNHNFYGKYCRCDELYDPDREDDVMYQCVVCEDWFHQRCIGEIPDFAADFESYICRGCTAKHPFLIQDTPYCTVGLSKDNQKIHEWMPTKENIEVVSVEESVGQQKRKADTIIDTDPKKRKTDKFDCKMRSYESQVELFLASGWRSGLCSCNKCEENYQTNELGYLKEEEKVYEPEDDDDTGKSLLEAGMEHFQRMDRVQAVESALAYNAFAGELKQYLKKFQEAGEVVKKEDILAFFAEKRRVEEH